MSKIIITGASGFIGANLVKKNFRKNEIHIFARKNSNLWRLKDIKSEINRRLGMPIYIPLLSVIVCFLFSTKKELIN